MGVQYFEIEKDRFHQHPQQTAAAGWFSAAAVYSTAGFYTRVKKKTTPKIKELYM